MSEWDGRPSNPEQEGWHMLRRKSQPKFNVTPFDEPWRYVPHAVYRYNGPDETPWHSRGAVYRTESVARDWDYIGPMTVETVA